MTPTKPRNFHEAFAPDKVDPPKPRATGIVFAIVCAIVAVLFRDNAVVAWPSLALSVAFALTAWLKPAVLGPLNIVWFQFALLLNRVMSPLIMFVLFAAMIVPYGLAMQIFRDPLRRRRASPGTSYWIVRPKSPIDLTQQF